MSQDTGLATAKPQPTPRYSKFVYSELKDPQRDIRLLELLPRSSGDEIRLRIFHVALPERTSPPCRETSVDELKRTLLPDWEVLNTDQDRYLYVLNGNDEEYPTLTSWKHPDPAFEDSKGNTPDQGDDKEALRFEAISYVWGSMYNAEEALVECPSQPHGFASLAVGQNLASALRHFRYEKTSRILWADAICINQSDIDERASQVLRMADIYSYSWVIVWLGPASESSDLAFGALQHFGQQIVQAIDGQWFPAPGAIEDKLFHRESEVPFRPETWDAIFDLLLRKWFTRIWVLQEIKLAGSKATIQCGHDHMPWSIFSGAVQNFYDKDVLPSRAFHDMMAYAAQMMRTDHTVTPMATTLVMYKSRVATDKRDKVYGLLGLLSPRFYQQIKPNYRLSIADVYKEVVMAVIKHTKRLDIVETCDGGHTQTERPSWVMDFGGDDTRCMLLISQFASLNSACHAQFQAPNKLKVIGVKVTTLSDVNPDHRIPPFNRSPSSSHEDILNRIRKACPKNLDTATYRTGESLRVAYALTLVGGVDRSRLPEDGTQVFREPWLAQESVNAWFGKHAIDGVSDMASLSEQERDALETVSGRVVVESDDGYIGLCPGSAQGGDIIAVLLGCESPMLLRPHSPGHFTVVGQCYIHGLLDGTALLGLLPKLWTVQAFIGPRILWDEYRYLNTETGELVLDDPRLEALPEVWERIDFEKSYDDPKICEYFKHKVSGQVINSDPRLEPEALRKRGVALEEFVLV